MGTLLSTVLIAGGLAFYQPSNYNGLPIEDPKQNTPLIRYSDIYASDNRIRVVLKVPEEIAILDPRILEEEL